MAHDSPRLAAERCQVWGVLNVTPDSFSDGARWDAPERASQRARELVALGADIVDVGAQSSRPAGRTYGDGAEEVSADEELRRLASVLEDVAELGAPLSIDTTKGLVARVALESGGSIINDVSGGSDPELLEAVAAHDAELVLMHNRGRGTVDAENTAYRDVVAEVRAELASAVERACARGVKREKIWLDPGLGFAKTAEQSMALIGNVTSLCQMGHRVLIGASRKSFIAAFSPTRNGQNPSPDERLGGSVAMATVAALQGAHAVRVHDVYETVQALRLLDQLPRPGAD